MARLHGRAQLRQRLHAKVPYGHWKTTSFIGATWANRIDAHSVFDRAVNGDSFLFYDRQMLVPEPNLSDVVVLGNLSSHKRLEVHRAIRQAEAVLLAAPQPRPQSERAALRKARKLFRKAADRIWTVTSDRIGELLNAFTQDKCAKDIRNSGYRSD